MADIVKYSDHQVIRLRGNAHIHRMLIGDSWDSLNLTMMMRITYDATPANNDSIAPNNIHIGFCSGPGTGRDSYPLSAVNYIGVKFSGTSEYNSINSGSGYSYVTISRAAGGAIVASKYQGATETAVNFTNDYAALPASTLAVKYGIVGIQVNRSAGTMKFLGALSSTAAYDSKNLLPSEIDTFKNVTNGSVNRGSLYEQWTSAVSIAMPTGPLDHINIYHGSTARKLEIHAIDIHRLA